MMILPRERTTRMLYVSFNGGDLLEHKYEICVHFSCGDDGDDETRMSHCEVSSLLIPLRRRE
jgi:hypothetical protein